MQKNAFPLRRSNLDKWLLTFVIAKIHSNDKQFTMTDEHFLQKCKDLQTTILQKIGSNGKLPKKIEDFIYMSLNEVDDLMEHYFTYKFPHFFLINKKILIRIFVN